MSDDPLLAIIPGDVNSKPRNLIRLSNMEQNIQNVRREFVGKPEVCHEMVKLIIYCRRGYQLDRNISAFYDLWNKYQDVLLKEYDVRWLISVCDTVVDVGDGQQSAIAMNIVQCVQHCNIQQAIILAGGVTTFNPGLAQKKKTWHGMQTMDWTSGDMIFNMQTRLNRIISQDEMMHKIWMEIKSRLGSEKNLPMNQVCSINSNFRGRNFFL
jgi:DNA-binding winged helix-turn-helix (wHTH) protein